MSDEHESLYNPAARRSSKSGEGCKFLPVTMSRLTSDRRGSKKPDTTSPYAMTPRPINGENTFRVHCRRLYDVLNMLLVPHQKSSSLSPASRHLPTGGGVIPRPNARWRAFDRLTVLCPIRPKVPLSMAFGDPAGKVPNEVNELFGQSTSIIFI
jgi:hypothetical protein